MTITLFSLSLAFSLVCFVVSFIYKFNINGATCSMLSGLSSAINGDPNPTGKYKWAGYKPISKALQEAIVFTNKIQSIYSSLFPYAYTISHLNEEYIDKIKGLSLNSQNRLIQSPNSDNSEQISPNYQTIYRPYYQTNTILGVIYSNYMENIQPTAEAVETLRNSVDNIYANQEEVISEMKSYIEIMDDLTELVSQMQNVIGENMLTYNNHINFEIFISSSVIYSLTLVVVLFGLILVIMYNFKFRTINYETCRSILQVIWHFIFFVIILNILVSSFTGIFLVIGRGVAPTFEYLISEEYLKSSTGIYGQVSDSTIKYFETCLNREGTDFSEILSLKQSNFNYVTKLYSSYNKLINESNYMDLYIANATFFEEQNERLDYYLADLARTTTPSKHLSNDVTYCLDELSKWTDCNDENSAQIKCALCTTDRWVTSSSSCPSGYTYSKKGEFEANNCLVVSEWSAAEVNSRYLSACVTLGGIDASTGIDVRFRGIKQYETLSDNFIEDVKEKNRELEESYILIIEYLKKEAANTQKYLEDFIKTFKNYNENEDMYKMFNCSVVKNDIIGFYKRTKYDFDRTSIVLVTFSFFNSLCLLLSVYFLVMMLQDSRAKIKEILEYEKKKKELEERIKEEKEEALQAEKVEIQKSKRANRMKMIFNEEEFNSQNSSFMSRTQDKKKTNNSIAASKKRNTIRSAREEEKEKISVVSNNVPVEDETFDNGHRNDGMSDPTLPEIARKRKKSQLSQKSQPSQNSQPSQPSQGSQPSKKPPQGKKSQKSLPSQKSKQD